MSTVGTHNKHLTRLSETHCYVGFGLLSGRAQDGPKVKQDLIRFKIALLKSKCETAPFWARSKEQNKNIK
jgi:hypothetical protein